MSRIPFEVKEAAIEVVSECFYLHDKVKSLFVANGLDAEMYERYRPVGSKPKYTRAILERLEQLGNPGLTIAWRIIHALAKLPGSMDRVERNDAVAKASIAKLRALLTDRSATELDDDVAAESRRRVGRQKLEESANRHRKLEELRLEFLQLQGSTDVQARGYRFQDMLREFFIASEVPYEKPIRIPGQEIDGEFAFGGRRFLVEARWRVDPTDWGQLCHFKAKVDSKLESTLGLYVSMQGYAPSAVNQLHMQHPRSLLLIDGMSVSYLFSQAISLDDALRKVHDAAVRQGELFVDIRR